jgi:hypothetical protein
VENPLNTSREQHTRVQEEVGDKNIMRQPPPMTHDQKAVWINLMVVQTKARKKEVSLYY